MIKPKKPFSLTYDHIQFAEKIFLKLLLIHSRFEDIYNIRLAYQAYEAVDMKGMLIEQHTILRTLKVCVCYNRS